MNRETYNQATSTAPQDKSRIKIIGVGDGAGSALSHMYRDGCKYGASFILCNINCQSLNASPIPIRIQLGTNKLGAFNTPDIGRMEAEKSKPELYSLLSEGTELSLIIAGMGGGTGTGAAPVIASISKELGIPTVGIVTLPLSLEGRRRMMQALDGIEEMAKHVDTLLVINNEHLLEIDPEECFLEAYSRADEKLAKMVRDMTDIINIRGIVNLDLNDLKAVMQDGGIGFIGTSYCEGDDKVRKALEEALLSPLSNVNDMTKAKKILLNITIGNNGDNGYLSMEETRVVMNFLERFGDGVEIRWGLSADPELNQRVKATILATGFDLRDADPMMAYHLSEDYRCVLYSEELKDLIYRLKCSASEDYLYFPWEHVIESMRKYREKVCYTSERCPDCGEKLIELFYSSPESTWQQLCGRAGIMRICPTCCTQKSFVLKRMN